MPTYEYRCEECGHAFELFQSITAEPERECPECGKLKVVRLIGCGAALIFKGSGFYETDYRSENYKKAAQADKGTSSSTKGKASKSDSASKATSKKPKAEAKTTT